MRVDNPQDSPQIVSGFLNKEQIEAEAVHLAHVLAERGVEKVLVEHWFGKQEIAANQLVQAFQDGFQDSASGSSKRRVYFGDSDFVIRLPGESTIFEFCHEDELHVLSPDENLRNIFRSRWLRKDYDIRDTYQYPR